MCNSVKNSTKPNVTNKLDKVETTDNVTLENTTWSFTEMNGNLGVLTAEVFQRTPKLIFNLKEMRLNGNDGCNTLMGRIEKVEAEELLFGSVGGTKKYCGDKMKFTNEFKALLKAARMYEITGNTLILMNEKAKPVLRFKQSITG